MSWLEVSVRVSRQHAPLVESLLQNEPLLALTLTDDGDQTVLEPGVGETPLWPSVCVTALFDGDTPMEPLTQMLSLVPGVDRPEQVSFRKFGDQQWERVWMERFKPMRFGQGLWIVPGDQLAPSGAVHILRLDPGLAFGTGTHPTTRLCLEWVDGHDFKGQKVLDYGCGSGVLGVASALKGAIEVVCVDNDPQALLASRANAERNNVSDGLRVLLPEQYEAIQADVVMANILAGPLISLAPRLLASLRPGGYVVLSGILEEQAGEVLEMYQNDLEDPGITVDDGWVRIQGKKIQ
jgi:ribosomal protein L11 methyltransferase